MKGPYGHSRRKRFCGEVAERLKAHAWKACLGETLTRVRIPPSPPLEFHNNLKIKNL